MAKQRVLIIGHFFVHLLKAFVQKTRHMQAFSSLDFIANIYFHGVGDRTIAKFRKFDFHVVRQFAPGVIIWWSSRRRQWFRSGKFSSGRALD